MRDLIKTIIENEIRLIYEMKKLTTQEFIERSKIVHGDKYDYSKSVYTGRFQPITIICPIHGEYKQRADAHMTGQDCPICGDIKQSNKVRMSTEDFIRRAKDTHGNKYDYSQTEYFSRSQNGGKVKIICPVHGEFIQNAENHLKGSGCNKCAGRLLQDKDEFLKQAKIIFGDLYDYSQVDYKGAVNKVGIICKKHGLFTVTPTNHISKKSGCPICKESKGERLVSNILNKLNVDYVRQKTFNDCRGNTGKKYCRKLPFDFYLPNNNSIIEYDGRQHYEPVMEFGGEENFNKTKITDKIKNEFCKKNNINLLRIPFRLDPTQVERMILDFLNK